MSANGWIQDDLERSIMDDLTQGQYDAIVIGSGPGGAAVPAN